MAPPSTHLEREYKLDLELDRDLPDLRAVVARSVRLPDAELRTRYFDTADLRLWDLGITLRHRLEDGDGDAQGTWTLKLPRSPHGSGAQHRLSAASPKSALDRHELSWPGSSESVPAEITAIVHGTVRRSTLNALTELLTTRRRFDLYDRSGASWAELDDDIVTVAGGHRDGDRFRQIELELAGADHELAGPVLRALQRSGARRTQTPKVATALGVASATAADRSVLRGDATLGELVSSSLASGLRRLLEHDYRLRVDPLHPDEEDIHQARVAARRLRSDLKTLRAVLDPVWVRHTRTELRWLGETLGRVRDADVLGARLQTAAADGVDAGGYLELQTAVAAGRAAALQELRAALSSDRYVDLLGRLHAAARRPPLYSSGSPGVPAGGSAALGGLPAAKVAPRLVGVAWKDLRAKVRKAGEDPSDRQLHRIRIQAKQLRYAAELTAPVIGTRAGRVAGRAERLQAVLGAHHDAVGAGQWLSDTAATASPRAAFVAGQLFVTEQAHQQRGRRDWRQGWKPLDARPGWAH